MSSFEGCWTISPASIDWTALNLCSGCSQSHLTLKQVCPVPLPWLTLHSTTRSPRAVMRHLISSFLPLTNRQIMVYGSLLLAINLVRGSFPATQACHCHGVPSALGWHLAHCAHSLDVPDLSLKSRQQVVEIARNCLQHASEHRYDLVRFACFGIQEVSPLNPLPYPFPGSLELFEKFQASPFPTIFIFRIQMRSNITVIWQLISTTHSYPFGQESCDNKTWCLQMIWLGSAVDPKWSQPVKPPLGRWSPWVLEIC